MEYRIDRKYPVRNIIANVGGPRDMTPANGVGTRLRLAYISPRFHPDIGGVETHVEQLARGMVRAGHIVDVLTETARSHSFSERIDGLTIRRFALAVPSQHYSTAPGLWAHLARQGDEYDLIHAHNYHALAALAPVVVQAQPLVFTPHYHGTSHSRWRRLLHVPYRFAGAAIFWRSRAVICVSAAEREVVVRHFPFIASRIHVIPNGINYERLLEADRFAKLARRVILTVGRLEDYKRVDRVIAALPWVDERMVLCVVGEGPARPRLERLVARLELQDRVRFLGHLDDATLARWYRTAAVYVSMSEQEAFGITVTEALTAGAAVVASDIGAHRQIAQYAENNGIDLLSSTARPLDLANAINTATLRPVGDRKLSVSSWNDVVERTNEVYLHVLAMSRRGE